jgi:hypothetical protein
MLLLFSPTLIAPVESMEHYSFDPVIQERVNIAYDISSWDEDFIYTLQWENDRRSLDRQSDCVLTDSWSLCWKKYLWMWVREQSYWICQISKYWYPHIINDSRFRIDARWQIEQCHKLYLSNPYLFSAYSSRYKHKNKFIKTVKKKYDCDNYTYGCYTIDLSNYLYGTYAVLLVI